MASKTLTIEIGNEFIKICESERKKDQIIVHTAVSVQTPEESVEDGFIRNNMLVSTAIRQAMTQEQITAKEVVFVLSSSRIASKEVILPGGKKVKIQELIDTNASEYFPINVEEYVFSYTVLEAIKTKEEQKTRVLVYAAPDMMVQSYYELAATLGMKVKAVDYSGNSTLQLIKIQIDKKPTLVVQLGMDTTIASVMVDDVLRLQRTIPYGESLLLQSVVESRKVSTKVALELLSQAQIVKESLDADETTGSLKYLINNVNRVIEYYSSRNTDTPIEKIVIIGEGADVMGMDILFSNETGLPAERLTMLKNVEPYNRMKISNSVLRNYMANFGASLDPIHLEPKSAKMVKNTDSSNDSGVPYFLLAGIFAIAAVGLFVYPTLKNKELNNKLDDIKTEISNKEGIHKVYEENEKSKTDLLDAELFDSATHSNAEYTYDLLKYFEKIVPKDMQVKSLNVTNNQVSVTVEYTDRLQLIGFVEGLEEGDSITYDELEDKLVEDGIIEKDSDEKSDDKDTKKDSDEEKDMNTYTHIYNLTVGGYSSDLEPAVVLGKESGDNSKIVEKLTADIAFNIASDKYLKDYIDEGVITGYQPSASETTEEEAN